MDLHLIGGFLGSGKTTAILGAARELVRQGKRVGIITNEQGKHLVDTGFLRSEGLPALEVTGGCICCHLDDFTERVEEITSQFDPHVLFAESVGSCTDLVATVIKPLLDARKGAAEPASLSVFADSRLLLRWLRGLEMPFSDGVMYIFEQQIEEAGLLVANKIDLLGEPAAREVARLARKKYPRKQVRLQNSLDLKDVRDWMVQISTRREHLPARSLDLDYDRYAAGEGCFVWIDREYRIGFKEDGQAALLVILIQDLIEKLHTQHVRIAHLKWLVGAGGHMEKFSLTGADDPDEILMRAQPVLRTMPAAITRFLLNMMAEGEAEIVIEIVDAVFSDYFEENGIEFEEINRFNRAPGYPQPTERIGN
jgi:G3E family GTPase